MSRYTTFGIFGFFTVLFGAASLVTVVTGLTFHSGPVVTLGVIGLVGTFTTFRIVDNRLGRMK